MTVSYNQDIINSHSLTFLRVIFRWRGSLWKSVLYEGTLWLLCYYTVMFVYRMQLKKVHQIEFEHIAKYTDEKMDYIPLSFMHGFYVAFVVDRWKQIFANIGFVDSAAFWIATYVAGSDYESRTHRRNLIRYLCLTQVLVLRDISIPIRRRFPTMDSLVEIGLLQDHEKALMESVHNGFPRYWMPIHWVFTLGHRLTRNGKLTFGQLETILNEAKAFREKLQQLINYDWVPVPLAYSQVVFMATRVYFFLCLFSRQFRIWEQRDSVVYIEYYFPLMTFLQLICYMGWLKVAESLLNPLGDDDDDFESSYIVDRNLAIGMTMVDECYEQMPDQMPDKFGREGEIPPTYAEPSLDPQHQLVGSAKLAAENNPGVLNELLFLDSRRSSINPERKRSIFTRLVQRAVGSRAGHKNRRASMHERRPRCSFAVEEESNGSGKEIPRKSKSIACSPFASSYDSFWRKAEHRRGSKANEQNNANGGKGSGMEQLKFDKTLDGKDGVILGKFAQQTPQSPSYRQTVLNFDHSNEFKHMETLSEEEDENSSNADNGNSRRSRSISTEGKGGGEEADH